MLAAGFVQLAAQKELLKFIGKEGNAVWKDSS